MYKYYDVSILKLEKNLASKVKEESKQEYVNKWIFFFAFPFSTSVLFILLKEQKPKKIFLKWYILEI